MTPAAALRCCGSAHRCHGGHRALLLARVSLSVANFVIIAFIGASHANARVTRLGKLPSAALTQVTADPPLSQQQRSLLGSWNTTHAGKRLILPPRHTPRHTPIPSTQVYHSSASSPPACRQRLLDDRLQAPVWQLSCQ